MSDSIENMPAFKAYFANFSVSDINKVFRFNMPDYQKDRAYIVYDDFHNGFIYSYYGTETSLETKFFETPNGKILELGLFFLPRNQQNQRQGLVTLTRMFNLAQDLKIDEFKLTAMSSKSHGAIGGYYWASMAGESFIPSVNTLIAKYKKFRFGNDLETKSTDQIKTLYDLSQDGRKSQNDQYWPGKEFLLNESWSGGWNLNNPMQMRRSYTVLNSRLQTLLLDISQGKNRLFSENEVAELLDTAKTKEEIYAKQEQKKLNMPNAEKNTYKEYKSSAVNRLSLNATKQFIKDFSQKSQSAMAKAYPELANNYKQVQTILESTNKYQKSNKDVQAKISAIKIERKLGKAALESIKKQQKSRDRGR